MMVQNSEKIPKKTKKKKFQINEIFTKISQKSEPHSSPKPNFIEFWNLPENETVPKPPQSSPKAELTQEIIKSDKEKIEYLKNNTEQLFSVIRDLKEKLAQKERMIQFLKQQIQRQKLSNEQIKKTSFERMRCPKCKSANIKKIDDKTQVLSYLGNQTLYRKKLACKNCRYEWK
jgi:hypothetical protein